MATYETDVYAWSQAQATLLKLHKWDDLDLDHVVEEILAVGDNKYDRISSALCQVLVHLLKWYYQPGRRTRSWRTSLVEHRNRVSRLLERAETLEYRLPQMLEREYPRACRKARTQTGLPRTTFPTACPWSVEQLRDFDFPPEDL
jgi:hypothetical protein